jgi:DnaJ-class molecular chaperone
MPQYKELRCPECDGSGFDSGIRDEFESDECYYCMGTGYATDEDSKQPCTHMKRTGKAA